MFQRRKPLTRSRRLREAVWPSMGIRRTGLYYRHRLARLSGTPRHIAGGIATGIAISFTPFIGLHILIGFVIASICRFSNVGMVIGTLIGGNPWTFPIIWVGSYKLGHIFMGHQPPPTAALVTQKFSLLQVVTQPMDWFVPMLIGSLPLVCIAWVLFYYIFKVMVARYQGARLDRIAGVRI